MPVVIPAGASSSSSAQSVPSQVVFDYILDDTGAPVVNAKITAILNGDFFTSISPQVLIQPTQLQTTTDGNGFWQLSLVPNTNLSPANTTYTIQTPFRSYDIQVGPSGPYQSTSLGTLVSIPVTLGPATSSITGALSVSGAFAASAGATISGGLTVSTGTLSLPAGGFTMAGPLTLTAATSQIIPGVTSFSVRDTANANDNLLVSNAGVVTARAGLVVTAGGLTVTAGNITAPASNLNLGTGTITSGVINSQTISAVASLTGSLTVANGLTVTAGGLTVTAGDATVTAGRVVMAAAVSKIVPGATSLSLRNNADNADNLILTNAGLATLRNGLLIPPSAAGAVATSAYGSVEVKISELAGDGTTNAITFSAIPTNFRTLVIEVFGRATNAVTNNNLQVQLNADATGVYEWERGNLTGAAGTWASAQGNADTSMTLGFVTGTTAPANTFGYTRIEIALANSSTLDKVLTARNGFASAYSAGNVQAVVASGWWHNAVPAAVTSVKLITSAGFFATTALAILRGKP